MLLPPAMLPGRRQPPPGAFQMAGSTRSFCQGLEMALHEWYMNIFFRQGVQLDHKKLTAQPRCCTPPLCVGFANALPRLLVKRSRRTQVKEFHSFPASKQVFLPGIN